MSIERVTLTLARSCSTNKCWCWILHDSVAEKQLEMIYLVSGKQRDMSDVERAVSDAGARHLIIRTN